MNHIAAESVAVFKTKDYKQFKFLKGNRALNDLKIKKIIAEIDNGNDMLKYYPIQVKESGAKLEILDGQHRFHISKFFQRNVYYILVKEEKAMSEIARINSNVEKWKMTDFLNCYIENGNNDYKNIQDFLNRYPVGFSVALRLLSSGTLSTDSSDENCTEKFRNGSFKVSCLDKANEIGELCKMFSASDIWKSRAFIIAVFRIHEAGLVPVKAIADIFKKNPDTLTRQANYKGYITNLEAIYNVRKHNRTVII